MPDTLLITPCTPLEAGTTVRSLGKGYVENLYCIRKYELLLNKQREYKKKIESIYDTGQQ